MSEEIRKTMLNKNTKMVFRSFSFSMIYKNTKKIGKIATNRKIQETVF